MDQSPEYVKQELTVSDEVAQHFFLYIIHLKRAMDKAGPNVNKKIIEVWIDKLMEKPHPQVSVAMKRNMYMAQLILNLYDGKIKAPFMSLPPNKPLETFDEFPNYGGPAEPKEKIVEPDIVNKELALEELNQVSSDGRTYVAIQSLDCGATLFGYVAVTVGRFGAGSLWMNSQGETIEAPIPKTKDLPVNITASQGIQFDTDDQTSSGLKSLANEVWKVLSRRHPIKVREQAGDLYRMLYSAIEQEMLTDTCDTKSSSCTDPYVNKLLDFLVEDLMDLGIRDPKAFYRQNLLSALKKRTKVIVDEIDIRRGIFEKFKTSALTPMMQLNLRPTLHCPSFISLMTLNEALEGTMNRKTMDLLSVQYPSCVINQFKKLITNEKVRTMNMAKIRLDNITNEMLKDLKASILQGLRGYQKARMEWDRVWRVNKEYDDVQRLVSKTTGSTDDDNSDGKFVEFIEIELSLGNKQLENYKSKTEKMENEIELLHKKIHEANEQYLLQKASAKREANALKSEIVNEELAVQQRIATINHLKSMK